MYHLLCIVFNIIIRPADDTVQRVPLYILECSRKIKEEKTTKLIPIM